MSFENFERVWETEYLKARVDRITDAVKNRRYDSALDYLSMIQSKAKDAEILIENMKKDGH
ncbi:hypothetical protein [Ruminiclostridium cellobioparum]|uniref:Uncharacterized protein n=1 Tax=Ruminiclostridium cellobioparum subsp. termitidis CT1112 TaxID=1195236 RepID=S0FKA3_RUMCE|nr:hypothetical protein [Ruminiclostridium cellobioparum]EMS72262.1 hypothetical protein CTER_1778 [Ruminiclostridium cellobioparum subsp. termitidis CT1112]